ncbi:MAG: hypothetical protein WKF84_13745 [Pyrinomonadaceae bacterium]
MYAQRYQRPINGVSQAAYGRLFAHGWPGNVRELQKRYGAGRAARHGYEDRVPSDLPFDNGAAPEAATTGVKWDVPPNMTAGRHRKARHRAHAPTHRRQQTSGRQPAGYLPPASLQQDQEIQDRRQRIVEQLSVFFWPRPRRFFAPRRWHLNAKKNREVKTQRKLKEKSGAFDDRSTRFP